MNKGTVLVTGANGFLGQAIVTSLLNSDIPVRTTDIVDSCNRSDERYVKADITRRNELEPVLKNVTTVIHTAGLAHIFSPGSVPVERYKLINEVGTANVLSLAVTSGTEHVILISSVSVYGSYTRGMYDEKTPCCPDGPPFTGKAQTGVITSPGVRSARGPRRRRCWCRRTPRPCCRHRGKPKRPCRR